MTIPFHIIRENDSLMELRSKYHYWILLKNSLDGETYFIYHKHRKQDNYHRQQKRPVTLRQAILQIKKHDEYVTNTNRITED